MPIARRTILVAILTALCAPMAASAAETRVPAEAVAMVTKLMKERGIPVETLTNTKGGISTGATTGIAPGATQ